eukprot:CAMPEP_0171102572 /NCGR_PEP_ID=MMETSP0766_2-20121228/58157_1 /TAXON_ID=439317 /ORGANISM="Gambierdiscus australes, Strain CAWD 149" /LENGTH=206 /DNA_ID=CAMNT_0011562891 /DNA_START=50 /DNA_END=670 /DNA_ORIENTATION=+
MALQQPKKPVGGAYGQFLAEKRADFAKACEGQKASAVTKLAGESWKKLTDAEKEPYQKKYEAAKVQFDKDMAEFLNSGGTKTKSARAQATEKRKAKEQGGKGKRSKKDPNRPKKPAGGGFGIYLNKYRADFMKECSKLTDATKLASTKWKALTEAQKKPYEDEYAAKQKAYTEAMKNYTPPAGEAATAVEEGEGDEDDEGEEEEDE